MPLSFARGTEGSRSFQVIWRSPEFARGLDSHDELSIHCEDTSVIQEASIPNERKGNSTGNENALKKCGEMLRRNEIYFIRFWVSWLWHKWGGTRSRQQGVRG